MSEVAEEKSFPRTKSGEHIISIFPGYGPLEMVNYGKEPIEITGFWNEYSVTLEHQGQGLRKELFYSYRETGSVVSLAAEIYMALGKLEEGVENRKVLSGDEVNEIWDLIKKVWGEAEGGQKNKIKERLLDPIKRKLGLKVDESPRLLTQEQVAGSMLKLARGWYEDCWQGKEVKASEDWDALRLDLLLDKSKLSVDQRKNFNKNLKKIEEENPELMDFFYYLASLGSDPQTLQWSEIMRAAGGVNEEILETVGVGEIERDRELLRVVSPDLENELVKRKLIPENKRVEAVLGVNPRGYFEKELLKVVERRLTAMRGEFDWRVSDDKDKPNKMVWAFEGIPPKDEDEEVQFYGGFEPSILAEEQMKDYFTGTGVISAFLSTMGRRNFWEGKRLLDIAFWSKYMGQVEDEHGDLYAKLGDFTLEGGLRAVAGARAQELWALDANLRRAQHVLFATEVEDKNEKGKFYWRPITLRDGVKQLLDEGVPKRSIQEALMVAQLMGLDMSNTSSKDRTYTTNKWRTYYLDNGWVTDVYGRKLELVGEGFGLTDTKANKMYMYDPRNADVLYAASSDDRDALDRKKNNHQRTKHWQTSLFYIGVGLRGIYGGRKTVSIPKSIGEYGKPGERLPDDVVLPGHSGEFWEYSHNLRLEDPDDPEKKYADKGDGRCYIHRRAIYKKLEAVLALDKDYLRKGYEMGKPGYETRMEITRDMLDFKVGDKPELREIVEKMLEYFKETREIDYLDGNIGELVDRVLGFGATWGNLYSLEDPECFELQRKRCDLQVAMEYEVKAKAAGGALLGALGLEPYTPTENLTISCKQINEIVKTKLTHRYNKVQIEKQMMPIYEYAYDVSMIKLFMMLADQQQMEQTYANEDMGRVGMLKFMKTLIEVTVEAIRLRNEIVDVIKDWADIYDDDAVRTLVGQGTMINSMFIYRETNKRLNMIQSGLQAGADNVLGVMLKKLQFSRALTYANARELIWKTRAEMWAYIGKKAEKKVPEWQHLDIVWEEGVGGKLVTDSLMINGVGIAEHKRTNKPIENILAVQDIQPEELDLFFNFYERGTPQYDQVMELYVQMGYSKRVLVPSEMISEKGVLVFKGKNERMKFFMSRTGTLLNLFYGRGKDDKVALPVNIFGTVKNKYGEDVPRMVSDSQLIRQVDGIYERARAVDRTNVYIEIVQMYGDGLNEGKKFAEIDNKIEIMLHHAMEKELIRPVDAILIKDAIDENMPYGNEAREKWRHKTNRAFFIKPVTETFKFFKAKVFGNTFTEMSWAGFTVFTLVETALFATSAVGAIQGWVGLGLGLMDIGLWGVTLSWVAANWIGWNISELLGNIISDFGAKGVDRVFYRRRVSSTHIGYPLYLLNPEQVVIKYGDKDGVISKEKEPEIAKIIFNPKFKAENV